MNIYLISQTINGGYDTYDSAVVVANTEEEARGMYPGHGDGHQPELDWGMWAPPEDVTVKWLGIAAQFDAPEVVCASFNAG